VRVLDALTAIVCQSLVVATVLGVSLIAAARDAPWGPAVAVGAGLALAVLGVAALLLRQRRRGQVLALIAAGRERLPLAPVERERRRLLDWHTRSCLAACLETVVEEAGKRSLPGMPALFDRRVVGAVSCELLEVAELLRAEPATARGIALAWWLISDGVGSPLHRGEVTDLRSELGRIRFLLSDGTGPAGRAAR